VRGRTCSTENAATHVQHSAFPRGLRSRLPSRQRPFSLFVSLFAVSSLRFLRLGCLSLPCTFPPPGALVALRCFPFALPSAPRRHPGHRPPPALSLLRSSRFCVAAPPTPSHLFRPCLVLCPALAAFAAAAHRSALTGPAGPPRPPGRLLSLRVPAPPPRAARLPLAQSCPSGLGSSPSSPSVARSHPRHIRDYSVGTSRASHTSIPLAPGVAPLRRL